MNDFKNAWRDNVGLAPASISVIVPLFNAAPYIAEAIQSVFDQSISPAEIIVVDDGSTDDSAAVAKSCAPRVRYFHQANLGPADARNLGVSQATGNLLAFLDADDLWTPDKLARQMQVLKTDPACEAVLGRVENFISPELDENQRQMLTKSAAQTGDFHIGALLICRAAFLRIGSFDICWRHGEFIEWWARAMRLNLTYTVLPDLVLRRRLHTNNLMRRERNGRQEYLPILRKHLAQRRAPAAQTDTSPHLEQP